MNYSELYKKAQQDLENVRIQKAQIRTKISELAKDLDLDEEQDLRTQVEDLKKSLEARQAEYAEELDRLAEELKKFDDE